MGPPDYGAACVLLQRMMPIVLESDPVRLRLTAARVLVGPYPRQSGFVSTSSSYTCLDSHFHLDFGLKTFIIFLQVNNTFERVVLMQDI